MSRFNNNSNTRSYWETTSYQVSLDKNFLRFTKNEELVMLLDLFKQYGVDDLTNLYEKLQVTLEKYKGLKEKVISLTDELDFYKERSYNEVVNIT